MMTDEALQAVIEQAVSKLKAALDAQTDNLAELVDLAIERIEEEQEYTDNLQEIYDELITQLSTEPQVMYMEYGRLVEKMFTVGLSAADEETLEFLKKSIDISELGDMWIKASNENRELSRQLAELRKLVPANDISPENESSS